jgi:hypothetical protein
MMWWSVQRTIKYKFIAAGDAASRARQHHGNSKGKHKQKNHHSGLGGFFEYTGALTLFMYDDARCGAGLGELQWARGQINNSRLHPPTPNALCTTPTAREVEVVKALYSPA